ncbi:MAG: periplasmic heavy metal sensor [Deltaproteobacteria bacterium]|nr:periplasmic heavy metal sensor [Deltaproteobacteria bacterium]
MKKMIIVIGSLLLVGSIAGTAFSWGPGFGKGRHSMAYGDRCPIYNERYGGAYGSLTEDQRVKIEELDRRFYDETVDLRDKLRTKSAEMGGILNDKEPDMEKAKALLKEINDLKDALSEKGLEYQLESRKILPDSRYGRGYGIGYGPGMSRSGPDMGYGPRMFRGGPGMAFDRNTRGFGPGPCWK